uniref:Uncharacterized protein n=1 Tax=Bacillus cereus HuA4-10 TaxID=1053206 RepID=J8DP81_BACCE|nr:hypothetical protein IGC_03106 [Bacillus cereus HuA4-10]
MSLLYNGLTFLNFDDTYLLQNKLHSYSHEDIDFTHLEHSNLYCENPSLMHIKRNYFYWFWKLSLCILFITRRN